MPSKAIQILRRVEKVSAKELMTMDQYGSTNSSLADSDLQLVGYSLDHKQKRRASK
jgi:hypothetical protein